MDALHPLSPAVASGEDDSSNASTLPLRSQLNRRLTHRGIPAGASQLDVLRADVLELEELFERLEEIADYHGIDDFAGPALGCIRKLSRFLERTLRTAERSVS